MQFVVFGANETLLPLLRAAPAAGHTCVATTGLGRWGGSVDALTPDALRDLPWELFIDQAPADLPLRGVTCRVDGVVLALDHTAGTEERELRSEQLRKLAAAGMSMLAVLPVCEGIVGYELDMIRRDTGVTLLPYSPLAAHVGAQRIAALVDGRDTAVGEVEQLVLERCAPTETDARRLELFALDAHLIDCMLGGLREVSASSAREGTLEQLAAHMQGRHGVARWHLIRGGRPQLKVAALGAAGRVEWSVCDAPGPEHAEDFGKGVWTGVDGATEALEDDGAREAWNAFSAALGEPTLNRGAAAARLRWDGGCRAAEAADHAPRSVRRGRAVAMQDQTPTEEDTFKGMMAAGSCGMLMLVLLIFVVWGVIESVRLPSQRARFQRDREAAETLGQPQPAAPKSSFWLRIWPVYPLALLLALQLFRLAFPTPPARQNQNAQNARPRGKSDAGEEDPQQVQSG